MSSRKKDPFSEAIVGIFMLAVLALLVYFTIIISGVDVLQGRRKVVANVEFSDVGGLKDHDNVMYRGTKVGTVDKIILSPTNLIVAIEIDRDVVLRESYRIAVCNLSMLGGNYLLLEEGEGEALQLDTTLFKGEQPTDWMRDVSNIAKNLNEFTSGGELKAIVTNIEAASEKVLEVVSRVERGEGTIGKLLSSDDTVYRDIAQTVSDAKTVVSNANIIVERVERGEGTIGKLLSSDDTVYRDLAQTLGDAKTVVSNASIIVERVERGEGTIGKLLSSDDTVYRDIAHTVSNANVIVERVERGEGTIGKLLSADDTVYQDLKRTLAAAGDIAERIRAGEGFVGRLLAKDDPLGAEIDAAVAAFRKACESFDAREVMESANTLLASLNATAAKIEKGEGTIGKLINESELYDEINALAKDVRQVMDNFRDTTPISTFGSLIMGGL